MTDRVCKECGRTFQSNRPRAVCGTICGQERRRRQYREAAGRIHADPERRATISARRQQALTMDPERRARYAERERERRANMPPAERQRLRELKRAYQERQGDERRAAQREWWARTVAERPEVLEERAARERARRNDPITAPLVRERARLDQMRRRAATGLQRLLATGGAVERKRDDD